MNWQEYEELVKNIYEILGKGNGVKIECYGNNCRRIGKSSVEHQIDVLTSHSDGIHNYLTAIECKYWNEKVTKDTVMKVKEIVDDCNIDKAVIVSKIGFTPDAISYAKFVKVELVELREPIDEDWEGRVKDIIVNMHVQSPQLISYENLVDQQEYDVQTSKQKFVFAEDYIYQFPDCTTQTIKSIAENFLRIKVIILNNEVEEKIDFPEGTIFRSKDKSYLLKVKGVKLKGKLTEFVEKIEIRGENYIWMIMKTVFEGKRFTVTKEGEIREFGNDKTLNNVYK